VGGHSTRERILRAALALFNADGPASVSTHRIAAELGISPGNLHYHFKAKHLIVERLFLRFEDRLQSSIDASAAVAALDDLWLTLHLSFETVDEYRFVFRDIDYVLRECPALEARAKALTARNLAASKACCQSLVEAGVLDASPHAIEMLAVQFVFALSCWYSFNRLSPRVPARSHGDAALAAYWCLSLLEPYVIGEARDYLNYLRAKYLR
jgi:AcrR family transcriptional regulator